MVRFVHKQLVYAAVVALTGVTAGGVGVAVNDGADLVGWWPAAVLGWGVLWGFASTTRLMNRGDLPLFEAAVPIADPAVALRAPSDARRWLGQFYGTMFGCMFVVTTALAIFEPLVAVFHLTWAMDPVVRAERAARWERQHRVLLWQGHVEQEQQPVKTGQPPVFTTPRQGALA